jgi:hypothetical protein
MMGSAIAVSDSLSNTPEQIEQAAKAIGRSSGRRQVFEAIYFHKTKTKSVSDIVNKTGLTRKRVLEAGKRLAQKGVVRQTKKDGETAYEKIDFFHAHKQPILRLAASPKKLAKFPTKRRIVIDLPKIVQIPSAGAKVTRITVDDIGSFGKVKKMKGAASLPKTMTENEFKHGIQAIVGEPGEFKDWGGEKSDLYSTRLRMNGKRLAAAFAFKGPGEKGKLVPGRMGKNGDQAQRLFQEDADVFIVQHWREIDPSVIDLLRNLAIAKSVTTGKRIWYGTIDGNDSERLRIAYPKKFNQKKPV